MASLVRIAAALAAVLGPAAVSAQGAPVSTIGPEPADSAAAAIATVWAQGLRPSLLQRLSDVEALGVKVDREAFFDCLCAALRGGATPFTPEAANAYMERRVQSASAADTVYAAEQAEWLRQKAAIPGVTVLPDGLVFEVITEGEGVSPTVDDQVEVNYVGRLSSGIEFDNSNGHPATFPVGRLIKGFTEGLTMMKPGGTYRLYIPSALGYGSRGAAPRIPGGAALDFTVELIRVIPAAKQ